MTSAPLNRTQPPTPGEVKTFRFPDFVHQRLSNGMRMYAARLARVPLVSLEILSPAGAIYDSPQLAGLASLHGDLLDEGTTRRSGTEIAVQVEDLGGSLVSGAGWDTAFAETGLLSRHLEAGLDLLSDIVCRANFPQSEIDRQKQRRLTDLLRRRDQPTVLTDRLFARVLYGDGVYGRALAGHEASIDAIDRDALVAFNRRHLKATGSVFLAVGDLDPLEMIRRVESSLEDWQLGETIPLPEFETQETKGPRVYIIDRPQAAQTQLQLGHVGVSRSHPDFARLMVLNSIFGGKFTSRINLNLREKHGFTYGAQSAFVRRLGAGPFLIRTAVANDVSGRSVEELLFELRRIRQEPVRQEELDDSRSYMIGFFAYSMQTVSDVLKRLENLAIFDLPDDYYDSYPDLMKSLSVRDLHEAAQRHLRPDDLAIIAAGPAAELRPQLEAFGEVEVLTPDEVMSG